MSKTPIADLVEGERLLPIEQITGNESLKANDSIWMKTSIFTASIMISADARHSTKLYFESEHLPAAASKLLSKIRLIKMFLFNRHPVSRICQKKLN